jgi:hypothetical protein
VPVTSIATDTQHHLKTKFFITHKNKDNTGRENTRREDTPHAKEVPNRGRQRNVPSGTGLKREGKVRGPAMPRGRSLKNYEGASVEHCSIGRAHVGSDQVAQNVLLSGTALKAVQITDRANPPDSQKPCSRPRLPNHKSRGSPRHFAAVKRHDKQPGWAHLISMEKLPLTDNARCRQTNLPARASSVHSSPSSQIKLIHSLSIRCNPFALHSDQLTVHISAGKLVRPASAHASGMAGVFSCALSNQD